MAKKNKRTKGSKSNGNGNNKPTQQKSVVIVESKETNTKGQMTKETTMSNLSTDVLAEITIASNEIKANKETKKAIKEVKFQIEAVEKAIKNRIKQAGSCTPAEKTALGIDFAEHLAELNLALEALQKKDEFFTAEKTEAFGVATADKIADFVEKSPINSGLSMVAQLKSRLKKGE